MGGLQGAGGGWGGGVGGGIGGSFGLSNMGVSGGYSNAYSGASNADSDGDGSGMLSLASFASSGRKKPSGNDASESDDGDGDSTDNYASGSTKVSNAASVQRPPQRRNYQDERRGSDVADLDALLEFDDSVHGQ